MSVHPAFSTRYVVQKGDVAKTSNGDRPCSKQAKPLSWGSNFCCAYAIAVHLSFEFGAEAAGDPSAYATDYETKRASPLRPGPTPVTLC